MQFLQDEYLDKVLYPIFGSSKRVYGSFGYSYRVYSSIRRAMAVELLTILFFLLVRTGAKIGGYAGDGLPTARAFASVVDRLIAHPNILNGLVKNVYIYFSKLLSFIVL
jgi:hypothetical protein